MHEIDCKQAKILITPYILGDLEPGSEELVNLGKHLNSCESCRRELQECQETVSFIQDHKAQFAQAFETLEEPVAVSQADHERSWRGIEAKLDQFEDEQIEVKRLRTHRIIWQVVTAAACLAIGIVVLFAFCKNQSQQKGETTNGISPIIAQSVKIEQILDDGGKLSITTGQNIETRAGEQKTLVINGKHRLLMNSSTNLTIDPLLQDNRYGCIVNLASGEIFANVKHDGKSFIVDTPNGRAVITGTSFDVQATGTSTTLVVSEGAVQFESEKGAVIVNSGYISTIFTDSAPSKPTSCDTNKVAAWAFDYNVNTAIAKAKTFVDDSHSLSDLDPTVLSAQLDLETIDFADWIKQKRPWFHREFPWIFQLKEALAKEGIETDYPQLLMQSVDIWMFNYPPFSSTRITTPDRKAIVKVVAQYGFNEQWFDTKISRLMSDATGTENIGLKAFEKWAELFRKAGDSYAEVDGPTLLNSIHASVYLANTRILTWLCISNGKYEIPARDKAKLLSQLETQYQEAHKLTNTLIRLLAEGQGCPCERYSQLLKNAIEGIDALTTIEQGLENHENR